MRALTELILALLAPVRGLWLLLRHPALWPYALPPLGLGVLWSGLFLLREHATPHGTEWYWRGAAMALELFVDASVLLIQLLIALSAPLLDWLGEQTEEALGVAPRGKGFWRELFGLGWIRRGLRALAEAGKLLGLKLALGAIALAVGLLPHAGPFLAYGLSGIATGLDFIDYPLARRDLPLHDKLAWARTHAAAVLAFGVGVFALLSLPVAAALLLPACVVGGTDLVFRIGPPEGQADVRS